VAPQKAKDSSSSDSSDTEEEQEVAETVLAQITPQLEKPDPSSAFNHSKEETMSSGTSSTHQASVQDEGTRASDVTNTRGTKRKRTENGMVTTAVEIIKDVVTTKSKDEQAVNGKGDRRAGGPFQRIKVDKIEYMDPRLMDNTFAARVSSVQGCLH
jgi:hypothetical protein